MSKARKDKRINRSALTVRVPISNGSTVISLAKWLNSLEGASEGNFYGFSLSELKLIILSARDRELSYRNQNSNGFIEIHDNLSALTENVKQITINSKTFQDITRFI